jgi:hypothetical protein
MTIHLAAAQASPAHTGTSVVASGDAVASVPASSAGFTCRGFPPECGYLLNKSATKSVMRAASAGGIAGALAACTAIPGVSQQ